jgi:hypothetical protein
MDTSTTELIPQPADEQSLVEELVADTFGGGVPGDRAEALLGQIDEERSAFWRKGAVSRMAAV